MSTVGQIEKKTQARIVALFRERLHYDYLGDRSDLDNRNIELTLLRGWLIKQGVSDTLINRALYELNSQPRFPRGHKDVPTLPGWEVLK